jgi:hypothetical protein
MDPLFTIAGSEEPPISRKLVFLNSAGNPAVTISLDSGSVELGPGCTADRAAAEFWCAVVKMRPAPETWITRAARRILELCSRQQNLQAAGQDEIEEIIRAEVGRG